MGADMKNLFSGFYRPTEEEFKTLWDECTFVFDTNTLLHLYRYNQKSRELLLEIMENIEDRIWIPYQVAMEYHKHLYDEMSNQENAYQDLNNKTEEAVNNLIGKFNDLRHSNINVDKIIQQLNSNINFIKKELNEQKERHPDLESIKNKIGNLIENKVGYEYTQEELDKIYLLGEERYNDKIPPGYMDIKDKRGKTTLHNGIKYKNEYGDLVYWFQILKHSKEETVKSVILITDDNKEDWVLEVKGKKKGPHPELIHEFNRSCSNKKFYLYNTEQFLEYAKEYLKLDNEELLSSANVEGAIDNIKSAKEFISGNDDETIKYGQLSLFDLEMFKNYNESNEKWLKDYYDNKSRPFAYSALITLEEPLIAINYDKLKEIFLDNLSMSIVDVEIEIKSVSIFDITEQSVRIIFTMRKSLLFNEEMIAGMNNYLRKIRNNEVVKYTLKKIEMLDNIKF